MFSKKNRRFMKRRLMKRTFRGIYNKVDKTDIDREITRLLKSNKIPQIRKKKSTLFTFWYVYFYKKNRGSISGYIGDILDRGSQAEVLTIAKYYLDSMYGTYFWQRYQAFYKEKLDGREQNTISNYTILPYQGADGTIKNNGIIDGIFSKIPELDEPMILYREFKGLDTFQDIVLDNRPWPSTTLKRTQCLHNEENSDCMVIYVPKGSKIIPVFMYYPLTATDFKKNHIEFLINNKGCFVRTPFFSAVGGQKYPIFYYNRNNDQLDFNNQEVITELTDRLDKWLSRPSIYDKPLFDQKKRQIEDRQIVVMDNERRINIKLQNQKDWEKRNPGKSYDTFLQMQEEEIRKQIRMTALPSQRTQEKMETVKEEKSQNFIPLSYQKYDDGFSNAPTNQPTSKPNPAFGFDSDSDSVSDSDSDSDAKKMTAGKFIQKKKKTQKKRKVQRKR